MPDWSNGACQILGTDELFPALLSGTGTFMLHFPYPIPKHNLLEKVVTNVRSFTTGWVPSHTPICAIKAVGYECEGRMDPETVHEVATHS